MKKVVAVIMSILLLMATMTACNANVPADGTATTGTVAEETTTTAVGTNDPATGEKIQIIFWHTLTDQHEAALKEIVAAFNASQEQY
ncbi:MAG: hypothetical protein PHW41_07040, partial [Eubacteriales bacterium]|nr:hypothetical protein [Eubacteriales bacterium]